MIWPGEAPPAVPYGTPVVAPPVVQSAPPAMGNVAAPPVYSDVAPAPFVPGGNAFSNPFVPTVVGPPVAVVPAGPPQPAAPTYVMPAAPGPIVGPAVMGPGTQDHLVLSPQRVLAPVGSEVVLKAGICTSGGYLLANQRVEWLLDRGGAGQLVDLNNRDELDLFRWPKNTPRKVDNWYAIGATSTSTLCLRRGNVDPNDDVQIRRGEAWITVTSPTEGTSRVTAYTPLVDDWQLRRQTATIYWVDAQWVFPSSAVVELGRAHVLTTTVTRRSDGGPIAGWTVRYEVAGGGASLGYGGGNFVDVPTDAAGRASVEVSPTGAGGGATTVNMTLIRPPQPGADASPQLEIGSGSATISWGTATAPAPTLPGPVASTPLPGPAPSTSPGRSPADTYAPPPTAPPPDEPELAVSIRNMGSDQVTVGDRIQFNIVVTNRGEGTARNVRVHDRFDRGLTQRQVKPGEYEVEARTPDLPPGGSYGVTLDFDVAAAGQLCHEATVTADGGARAVANACVTARQPLPVVQPSLSAKMTGPTRRQVGELAQFRATITNTGDVAVTNLKIVVRYDDALQATRAASEHEVLPGGGLEWNVERLVPGERREFGIECKCLTRSNSACNRVIVTADGGVTTADETCLEILPLRSSDGAGGAANAAASDLRLAISAMPNPTRVRQRTRITVTVENTSQQPQQQVVVRLLLPPEMTPVADQIESAVTPAVRGQDVTFAPIPELAAGGRQQFVVPVDIKAGGSVRISAFVGAAGQTAGNTVQSDVITIQPAAD